jgi:hypothetical protein
MGLPLSQRMTHGTLAPLSTEAAVPLALLHAPYPPPCPPPQRRAGRAAPAPGGGGRGHRVQQPARAGGVPGAAARHRRAAARRGARRGRPGGRQGGDRRPQGARTAAQRGGRGLPTSGVWLRCRSVALPRGHSLKKPACCHRPAFTLHAHTAPVPAPPPLQDTWLPELSEVVGRINTAFGRAFEEIGCAGEVALDDGGGGEDDFSGYSVKARAPHTQPPSLLGSMGEAGVAHPAGGPVCCLMGGRRGRSSTSVALLMPLLDRRARATSHLQKPLPIHQPPLPPDPCQVPGQRGAAGAVGDAAERRRAQRLHHPVPPGAAGRHRDAVPRRRRDQPGAAGRGGGWARSGEAIDKQTYSCGGAAPAPCGGLVADPASHDPRTPRFPQGMDPFNERKVFGQLVAASTRDGTPQARREPSRAVGVKAGRPSPTPPPQHR